jgi:hypothetical protein
MDPLRQRAGAYVASVRSRLEKEIPMKAFTLAFRLVTVLLASPAFGQRPTDKP